MNILYLSGKDCCLRHMCKSFTRLCIWLELLSNCKLCEKLQHCSPVWLYTPIWINRTLNGPTSLPSIDRFLKFCYYNGYEIMWYVLFYFTLLLIISKVRQLCRYIFARYIWALLLICLFFVLVACLSLFAFLEFFMCSG